MSKRVYVSSTFIDLVPYRAKVLERLRRSKSIVVAMEDYAAFDERPADKCLADVKGCDIYVGILAKRYGHVPVGNNPDRLSITEMEYRQACDAECTRLIFQLDPDAPWRDKFNDRLTGEGGGGAGIRRFRAEVGEKHGIRLFRDREELAGMVLEAIVAEISQGSPAPGDTEKPDTPDASQEIERYRQAVESLHGRIFLAGFKTKLRVSIDLEELYVRLQAIVDLRGSGDSVFADAGGAEAKLRGQGSRDIPLIDAFQDAKRRKRRAVVILGDPGSGKTTHLKRLLLACLRQGPEDLGLPAGTLPVFLPLRALEDLSKGIDAFIERSLDDDPHMKMSAGFGAPAGTRATRARPPMVGHGPRVIPCALRLIRGGCWYSRTHDFAEGKRVKAFDGIHRQAERKLDQLDAATAIRDLDLPGNRLEALKGDRKGQYSIRINDRWRICFEWPDKSPGPTNVEIVDYH